MLEFKKAKGFALAAKQYFAEGNMKLAGRYWKRIFTARISFAQHSQIMRMFTDNEVYLITDWNREHYYRAVGLI